MTSIPDAGPTGVAPQLEEHVTLISERVSHFWSGRQHPEAAEVFADLASQIAEAQSMAGRFLGEESAETSRLFASHLTTGLQQALSADAKRRGFPAEEAFTWSLQEAARLIAEALRDDDAEQAAPQDGGAK